MFGLGIILKDGLAFISHLMMNLSLCSENNIKIAVSVFQAVFIVAQTKYIFQFSKAYIRNCSTGSRYKVGEIEAGWNFLWEYDAYSQGRLNLLLQNTTANTVQLKLIYSSKRFIP